MLSRMYVLHAPALLVQSPQKIIVLAKQHFIFDACCIFLWSRSTIQQRSTQHFSCTSPKPTEHPEKRLPDKPDVGTLLMGAQEPIAICTTKLH